MRTLVVSDDKRFLNLSVFHIRAIKILCTLNAKGTVATNRLTRATMESIFFFQLQL